MGKKELGHKQVSNVLLYKAVCKGHSFCLHFLCITLD